MTLEIDDSLPNPHNISCLCDTCIQDVDLGILQEMKDHNIPEYDTWDFLFYLNQNEPKNLKVKWCK